MTELSRKIHATDNQDSEAYLSTNPQQNVPNLTQPEANTSNSAFTAWAKLRLRLTAYALASEQMKRGGVGQPSSSSSSRTCLSVLRPFAALLISEFETVQSIFSASLFSLNEISRRNTHADCVVFCPRRRSTFEWRLESSDTSRSKSGLRKWGQIGGRTFLSIRVLKCYCRNHQNNSHWIQDLEFL